MLTEPVEHLLMEHPLWTDNLIGARQGVRHHIVPTWNKLRHQRDVLLLRPEQNPLRYSVHGRSQSSTLPPQVCHRSRVVAKHHDHTTLQTRTKSPETPFHRQQLVLVDGQRSSPSSQTPDTMISDRSPPTLVGGVGPKHLVLRTQGQRDSLLEMTLSAPPPKIISRRRIPGNQDLLVPKIKASL